MRKSQITRIPQNAPLRDQAWMDLDRIASVEVSSEDSEYPIESALLQEDKRGWRAANPGVQTIRLVFDEPQKLKRILLVFEDTVNDRTQEFVLRWSSDIKGPFREIVHQQWNFSSPESVRETEDFGVELSEVKVLELMIVPDKSGGRVCASLVSLRLA
jgi:hypothetical protein